MSLRAAVAVTLGYFNLDAFVACGAGETVAIVGPNAAGKTTLLRAIAGLQPMTGGEIELNGKPLDGLPPERRAIGFVFQDHALFPHMSALDNVAFGAPSRQKATDWLERDGLAGEAASKPPELSGGQAQRVALARALAREPGALLLDEPLAALDAATRNDVRRVLRTHLAEFSGPRLLVSHDPVDVSVLADRVVVLDAGRVVQTGTPADITARPRHPWVADLAGTNLFRGSASGGSVIDLEGGGVLHAAAAHAGNVYAAVAPRAVLLHRSRPEGSPRNVWPGRVDAVELLGERVRVRVSGTPSITAEVTAHAMVDLALQEGLGIWVAVKATEIDVYSA